MPLLEGSFARSMGSDRPDLQRFHNAIEPGLQAEVRLEASHIAARRGDLPEARRLLRRAVQLDPECVQAWLRLAWLTEEPHERRAFLRQVLSLEPDHPQARAELARLSVPAQQAPAAGGGNQARLRLRLLALLVLAAALTLGAILIWGPVESSLAWLVPTPTPSPTPVPTLTPSQIAAQFVPQLETALAGENWERAMEVVAIMESVAPSGAEVQGWSRTAHMQYGQALVRSGDVESALAHFDRVVASTPGDEEARLWQETSQVYLAGQAALDSGDFETAIEAFSRIHDSMPGFGDAPARLVAAYRGKGEAAIAAEDWATAIDALRQARDRAPADGEVISLLSLAYRGQGQKALEAKDWTAAVTVLAEAHEQLPGDVAVGELLVNAYRERGKVRWEKGKLKLARADLEAALALNADDKEAQEYLDKVMYELFPPKRIEIDISAQRFYAWEGDNLIYKFLTSTGLPGRDTATGHYRVLDKIPMAYSSIWRLQMPHWLGIYYVGNVENGIHALPIRPDGSVMWGGLLGQKASYGCVILSTEAAQIIYNWADVGTPVDIHY